MKNVKILTVNDISESLWLKINGVVCGENIIYSLCSNENENVAVMKYQ
jgi:hypothetical protein